MIMCDCEFDFDDEDGCDSWHYLRICLACGYRWSGLHCPHDGMQQPCGQCGFRPVPVDYEKVTFID